MQKIRSLPLRTRDGKLKGSFISPLKFSLPTYKARGDTELYVCTGTCISSLSLIDFLFALPEGHPAPCLLGRSAPSPACPSHPGHLAWTVKQSKSHDQLACKYTTLHAWANDCHVTKLPHTHCHMIITWLHPYYRRSVFNCKYLLIANCE